MFLCAAVSSYAQNGSPMLKGSGIPIDTLDIGDRVMKVVLRDDNTWYYIKDEDVVRAADIYREYWDMSAINSYKDFPLSSLPDRTVICLVDSVSRWVCPYRGEIRSGFGRRNGKYHSGIDIPCCKGAPVKAAFDGRVRISVMTGGYGNLVVIRHENGLETYYGHLSERKVKAGDWVRAGDVIGLGGSTGYATGCHLHFEVRYKGYAFDPMWIADFETGKLRSTVFVLKRSFLDSAARYEPESVDWEDG